MCVLLQRLQGVELDAAHCALERAVVIMRERMLAQVAKLLEALVAHLAYVRPLVRVRSHMPLQHARETELLLAVCALQGALYLGYSAVRGQFPPAAGIRVLHGLAARDLNVQRRCVPILVHCVEI